MAASRSMPLGSGHNHLNIDQHRFACRVALAFFDSLEEELSANPDVILGEMDIESDIMAIAVAFPESGVLFYDVSNPANPVFKHWFRYSRCEEPIIDVDCGAYVDLSEDGKVAFLSLQNISSVPGDDAESAHLVQPTPPGVLVIDARDLSLPVLPSTHYPAASGVGGTHTSNSHVIPPANPVNPDDTGPRAPGEYLFSVANSRSVHISKVNRDPLTGVPSLSPVHDIELDESHDTFIQNDPLTGRTYLYVAAGFASGFYVYDVTNPAAPELKAEWDPTPECAEDWYGHTTFTAIRNGRRYVTIDAEIFGLNESFGEQSAEDKGQGCGKWVGNGNRAGPLWIVDVTRFSALGVQPDDDKDGEEQGAEARQLKARSLRALVTKWINPANRRGGDIEFSPHNQQIVGNRIYLSHYHGGVYMLNAAKAFRGIRGAAGRPTELAFVVPHKKPVRPMHEHVVDPAIPFISVFFRARPTVWDTLFYKGCVLIPDSTGGLYSYSMGGIACGDTNIRRPGGGDNGDDNGDDDD